MRHILIEPYYTVVRKTNLILTIYYRILKTNLSLLLTADPDSTLRDKE